MKRLAKLLAVSLGVSALITSSQADASSSDSIKVIVDNKTLTTSTSPYLTEGTVLAPLTLVEQLGVQLSWDNHSKTVTVDIPNQSKYRLKVGQTFATNGNDKLPLPVAVSIKENHVVVPLRFIAEVSGATVNWDAKKKTVVIQTGGPKDNGSSTTIIKLGENSYKIPIINEKLKKYSLAVKTSSGIVWSPAPAGEDSADSSIYYPATPFSLYLSDPAQHTLSTDHARKLMTLNPSGKDMAMILDDLYGVGDYVVYHTELIGKGMAQSAHSQAWVMKVSNPQSNKEIESFHSAGGYTYYFGIVAQDELYVSLSYIPGNADGSYEKKLMVYNLNTGKKEFPKQYTLEDGVINFKYNEKDYSVPIKQL